MQEACLSTTVGTLGTDVEMVPVPQEDQILDEIMQGKLTCGDGPITCVEGTAVGCQSVRPRGADLCCETTVQFDPDAKPSTLR